MDHPYGRRRGAPVTLPLGAGRQSFVVAGVWRDYARQSGAIQMRLADYQALSGDTGVNDAALWVRARAAHPRGPPARVSTGLRALSFGASLELSEPGDIRALSLKIFDRSFAVTYLLEAVAIVIGLFGIAATFHAPTMAHDRQLGMRGR